MVGDQQAATFGQACFSPGEAKNTYGTGCFLLMNTGTKPVRSDGGLLTTVGWSLNGEVTYCLEGAVFVGGAVVQWLRDGLGLISEAAELEALAAQCESTDGVYLVPAFVRLGARYGDPAARGPMLNALDQIIATAQLEAKARDSGQTSMFNSPSQSAGAFDQAGISGIILDGPDATNEEKAAWERELLGLSLSYNPLTALAGIDTGNAITSMDQLDEEMNGRSVTVLGCLSTTVARETKEHRRFLIATLDLLAGAIEVMVWPDTLERTQDQWKDGQLLKITGKLRVRGDQLSLACDQVETYAVNGSSQPSSADEMPASNGAASATPVPSGAASVQAAPNGNGTQVSSQSAPVPAGGRVVILGVTETSDSQSDAHLLREVVGVLLEYPGTARIHLKIPTGGHRVVMQLPAVNTGFCPQLHQRLESLLGADSVHLRNSAGMDVEIIPA